MSRRLGPRRMGTAMLACLALLAAGCGYSHVGTFPADVHTVAVPIFKNNSFYRGVENDLTEALIKDIELRTPYKVVAREHAETIIEGKIVTITQSLISRNPQGGLPNDVEVHVTVDFTWKNLRTGKTLRERKGISSAGRYVPAHPVGEDVSIGQHEAVDHLVEQIVSIMRADWVN